MAINTGITWDYAYLLATTKEEAGRPDTDLEMTDPKWDRLLSLGQEYWYQRIAALYPDVLMGPPTKLETTDSGLTYSFPDYVHDASDRIFPMGEVRLFADAALDQPVVIGASWDRNADFFFEGLLNVDSGGTKAGGILRATRNTARTYSDGPYARYIVPPRLIDSSTQPTLVPEIARALIMWRALIFWSKRGGGRRDPTYFMEEERNAWIGDPRYGDGGIAHMLGSLTNGPNQSDMVGDWWRSSDLGT